MKNIKMKRICIIVFFLSVILATACRTKVAEQPDDSSSITDTQENESDETLLSQDNSNTQSKMITDTENTDKPLENTEDIEVESIEPVITKEISIYTMDEVTLEVEAVVALVPESTEVTPELIVEMVVDSFADRFVTLGIDEVTTKDDTVIVSFLSDQPPLINVGSGLEATILDAIAQSLVDNLENYPKVIFRVEGEPYSSGHFVFGLDEVYLDVNGTN